MYWSIPASAGHPITEVANPVASVAAILAKCLVAAVIIILDTLIPKPSAKVSCIFTPLISIISPILVKLRIRLKTI